MAHVNKELVHLVRAVATLDTEVVYVIDVSMVISTTRTVSHAVSIASGIMAPVLEQMTAVFVVTLRASKARIAPNVSHTCMDVPVQQDQPFSVCNRIPLLIFRPAMESILS